MSTTFADLLRIDAALAAAGHHPLTAFWRSTLERWYAHPTARSLVGQIGRGGAKSHTSAKVGLAEVLCGRWSVGLGERHFFAFISASKDEATQRLALLESFLTALRVPYRRTGDEIALTEMGTGFRVFASQVALVSGFRCIGYAADELSKWRNTTGSRNPAAEVISSVNAMTITHPDARALLISSPWSTQTYHYRRMQFGDTDGQLAVQAPSWVANPAAITEAESHRREPDEQTWRREYAAEASDSMLEGFFPVGAIQQSIDLGRTGRFETPSPDVTYYIGVDAAFSATGDRFGWATISHEAGDWIEEDGTRSPPRLIVHETEAWRADREPREMARRLRVEVADRYPRYRCIADQYESFSFRTLAKDVGLDLKIVKWRSGEEIAKSDPTDLSKTQRFRAVLAAMLGGQLRLPDDPTLVAEFQSVCLELTPSGNERIVIPRSASGHGDRVSAIVLSGSVALTRRAQLPAERMTRVEWLQHAERERERERVAVAVSSGGGGAPSDLVKQARKEERRTTRFDPFSQPANDCGSTIRTISGIAQTGRKR